MALMVHCTYVNKTKGYIFGEDPEFEEAFTDNRGTLFRSLQQEYGRCASKMYRDFKDGSTKQVGWVFEKTMEYEDAHKFNNKDDMTYCREVWVEVINHEPQE